MLFTSFEFILFLPITLALYFFLPAKWRWILLLMASYLFYGYHNPFYILLLLLSTNIDFFCGQKIYESNVKKSKRTWLYLSIISNLGLLFFFKYFNFFSTQIADFFYFFDITYTPPKHNFLLPIGISFYTFQTLSYSIDIYRGFLKPETHFGKFALYVCFFPQLVAGPIERAKNLLAQFHFNYKFDYNRVVQGMQLILWGFFKKLVIADRLGIYVNEVFEVHNNHHGPVIIIATFLFFLQIFYDFAAYCDIAIGIARILGIKLSKNFGNHIYYPSAIEFWKYWHITLTEWFRDYVFFPLASLNQQRWFWHFSLILTFSLTGLWHGANWTFVIWGTLHGIYLVIDYMTQKRRKIFFEKYAILKDSKVFHITSIVFVTFSFLLPVLFFRATSAQNGFLLLNRAFDWSNLYLNISIGSFNQVFIFLLVLITDSFNIKLGKQQIFEWLGNQLTWKRWLFYIVLINLILYTRIPEEMEFIYFEF